MTYLTKNNAELDAKIAGSDPLMKLLTLGKRELSIAYDKLINVLN